MPYRLGLIQYTNITPLTHTLSREFDSKPKGYPTEINKALLEGRVDLANISAIEFIRHSAELQALPDFSVSVLGPVYSVNLFHKVPWSHLSGASIALTSQSATSVELLKVLLKSSGLEVDLIPDEGKALELLERGYAGVLRIGDDALTEWYELVGPLEEHGSMLTLPHSKHGILVTDLAMRWYEQTQLPFVFALWAYHKDNPPPQEVLQEMRQARRYGIGHLEEISQIHAKRLKLPDRIVQHYLWNFRYHLEKPDRDGLDRFANLAMPNHNPLTFRDSSQ